MKLKESLMTQNRTQLTTDVLRRKNTPGGASGPASAALVPLEVETETAPG